MADLKRLGTDLARVDRLIIDLVQRRMDLARLVGFEKMRTGQVMFRAEIEDQRLDQIAEYAASIGVNPHLARTMLYTLINESCKQQTILLQDANASDLELLEGEARRHKLRSNLLLLTEQVASAYDDIFYGSEFFPQTYAAYERERLLAFVAGLTDRELAVDLGCGTGHASFLLASEFASVVGLDVSQHMQYQATLNAERLAVGNAEFLCHDVDTGLPFESGSVSLLIANYGTASDFFDFSSLLDEIERVLKPGGGVFLSFYNKEAIVGGFGFLPWRTERGAVLNPYTNCLEVSVSGQQFSLHAQPYSATEVAGLLKRRFTSPSFGSFPLLGAVLPPEVLDAMDRAEDIARLERQIESSSVLGGTYLVYTALRVDAEIVNGEQDAILGAA